MKFEAAGCVRCGGWMALDRRDYTEGYCLQCGHRVYPPLPKPRPIPPPSYPPGSSRYAKGNQPE